MKRTADSPLACGGFLEPREVHIEDLGHGVLVTDVIADGWDKELAERLGWTSGKGTLSLGGTRHET